MTNFEAIRARVEAATEGPWVQNGCNGIHTAIGSCVALTYRHDDGQRKADAEFIAHTRQDIPDLLAVIDKVRAIHLPMPIRSKLWCLECESHYPCPTVRALGGDS